MKSVTPYEVCLEALEYYAHTIPDSERMAQACEAIRILTEQGSLQPKPVAMQKIVTTSGHSKIRPGNSEPVPTQKQLAFLRALGYTGRVRTMQEASALIDKLRS